MHVLYLARCIRLLGADVCVANVNSVIYSKRIVCLYIHDAALAVHYLKTC
jgi:hypothetical protein